MSATIKGSFFRGLIFVAAVGVVLGFLAGAAWLAGGATSLGVLR